MPETFLAYTRDPHPANDGRTNKSHIDAGINYDMAAEIDERNGWKEPGEILDDQAKEAMIQMATRGLNELILFCFKGQTLDRSGKGLRTAMRRFVSVCWMLKSSELLGKNGKPMSLEKLSKLPQLRCTRCTLSLLAQEFGRQWGFRVRVQKKESTKPNYADAAKSGWKKRRDRIAREEAARP